MVLEKNGQKKNLREHFWELLDELLHRISSVCRYCINSVYIFCKDYFFKG